MVDSRVTRDHNLDVLQALGFKKYSNTTVFHKDRISLLSPAVAKNQSGGYWFDVRKVNIERLTSEAYLCIRIVPDYFVLEPLNKVSKLITTELMDNRPKSGDVWGLGLTFQENSMTVQIFNKSFSSVKVNSRLLTRDKAIKALVTLT
ncbi:hypothetical protein VA7868_02289 [Vibrio aerogenes CECT 7868]|uniref:Uncharacterized protein n=2 Tax=Vibrio aerogenes TaxID=92172 RepID=A0A1M5Z4M8_9VIBR|nr:hypothetical protein VA7868_02289 [Vibrio aerogenes CECT 7868]